MFLQCLEKPFDLGFIQKSGLFLRLFLNYDRRAPVMALTGKTTDFN